jgi:hypothetical protein
MLDRVLALAGNGGRPYGECVTLLEQVEVGLLPVEEMDDRARPEGSPHHGCRL